MAIPAATATAWEKPAACAAVSLAPAVVADAAALESRPMNSDGPMEAATMFHVFMSAVPLACSAPESADRPAVCEGDIARPTPPRRPAP